VKTRVVVDTNVFISGIFFSGPPYQILKAWIEDKIQIAVSEDIICEYKQVCERLSDKVGDMNFDSIFELLLIEAQMTASFSFKQPVCEDPDDDKFLACAIASISRFIISGDKHLLNIGQYLNTEIVTPRYFVDNILQK
jgi:putative PIN family toxin of toxin-antitoxin system